ncbi:unnamed protein product, partial [Ectocarpus sp. 8 AP-2014]
PVLHFVRSPARALLVASLALDLSGGIHSCCPIVGATTHGIHNRSGDIDVGRNSVGQSAVNGQHEEGGVCACANNEFHESARGGGICKDAQATYPTCIAHGTIV